MRRCTCAPMTGSSLGSSNPTTRRFSPTERSEDATTGMYASLTGWRTTLLGLGTHAEAPVPFESVSSSLLPQAAINSRTATAVPGTERLRFTPALQALIDQHGAEVRHPAGVAPLIVVP